MKKTPSAKQPNRDKPKREFPERIKELRTSLGLDQSAFAKFLGVKQATISLYERGARVPSSEMYTRLSGLAREGEEISWFWRQAGLRSHVILEGARKQWKDKFTVPADWEVVEIGPLPGSQDLGTFRLPRWMVGASESTYYFLAGAEHTQLALSPGVVFIDTSEVGSPGHLPSDEGLFLAKIPQFGFIFGRLSLKTNAALEGYARDFSFLALLAPEQQSASRYEPIRIGSWRDPVLDREDWRKYLSDLEGNPEVYQEVFREAIWDALYQLQVDPGVEIIGRPILSIYDRERWNSRQKG